jgi:hypothetical protein
MSIEKYFIQKGAKSHNRARWFVKQIRGGLVSGHTMYN